VKLIRQNIDKSFLNGNQKITFEEISVGAFQSSLKLNYELKDLLRLSNVEIKYSYQNKVAEVVSSMDSESRNYNLAVGQLMKPGPITIELVSASYVEKAYTTVEFNMNTLEMKGLPTYLTLKNFRKTNDRIDFTLINAHGNYLDAQTSSFFGTFGISVDPEIPSVTNFFIECDNKYVAVIEIQLRDRIIVPFKDAKFILEW
jgi:hypothetical protein